MSQIAEYLPQLLLGWSIQWLGVLSPGPGVALVLSVATSRGRGPAVTTAAGIASGTVLLALITVLGFAAILANAVWLMTGIRFIGAAYLAYLAYKAFRTAIFLPPLDLSGTFPASKTRIALAGFIMQITNPKAIIYWIAVASVSGISSAPLPVIALFVAGAFFNSFTGHGAYAIALSSAPFQRGYTHARRWIEATLGVFFAYFAYRLATERS